MHNYKCNYNTYGCAFCKDVFSSRKNLASPRLFNSNTCVHLFCEKCCVIFSHNEYYLCPICKDEIVQWSKYVTDSVYREKYKEAKRINKQRQKKLKWTRCKCGIYVGKSNMNRHMARNVHKNHMH